MPLKSIIIGSRGSELALWQANWVKSKLESLYPSIGIEVKIIKTQGDRILDVALSDIGDKGLFTKAIEDALLDKSIDLAVHSLKDLPTVLPDGLGIAAVSERENPLDVFISLKYSSIEELPKGAAIATGSLRRKSQLLNYRKDLNIKDIRGNITTRIKKFEESGWDGIILAYAGVNRLKLNKYIKQIIPEDIILPAVSQGIMAIETRLTDSEINKMLEAVNNRDSFIQMSAERSFLKTVEGGCQIPVGVFTWIEKGRIHMKAMIGSLDGTNVIKCQMDDEVSQCVWLGVNSAEELLKNGGREILQSLRSN